jgi:hypothetical protein
MRKNGLLPKKERQRKACASVKARYRSLFENSAIPIFEEDFSQVKLHFDKLRSAGITNFTGISMNIRRKWYFVPQ